jgi:hypothetical protein
MFDSTIMRPDGKWWDPREWSLMDIGCAMFAGAIALGLAACGGLGFLLGWLIRRGA